MTNPSDEDTGSLRKSRYTRLRNRSSLLWNNRVRPKNIALASSAVSDIPCCSKYRSFATTLLQDTTSIGDEEKQRASCSTFDLSTPSKKPPRPPPVEILVPTPELPTPNDGKSSCSVRCNLERNVDASSILLMIVMMVRFPLMLLILLLLILMLSEKVQQTKTQNCAACIPDATIERPPAYSC